MNPDPRYIVTTEGNVTTYTCAKTGKILSWTIKL